MNTTILLLHFSLMVLQTQKQNFDNTTKHRILHRIKILNNEGYCNNR